MRRHILWCAGVFVVSGAYAGCSDSSDGSPGGNYGGSSAGGVGAEGGASGTGAGVAGVAGAAGSGGAIAGSSGASGANGASGADGASGALGVGGGVPRDGSFPDVVFTYDARPEDGGGVQGDGCASVTARAEASPLDMYIILDNSGSMHQPQPMGFGDCNIGTPPATNSKWCLAINALNGFFTAGSSANMGVALQYFNIGGDECVAKSTPAVALQNLPTHVSALATSLNNANPNGSTPTLAAAEGIVQYTRMSQRAGRRMIGIIITDGDPQGCSNNNPNSVNQALATHYQMTGIPTFIVGMDGASFNNLQTMGQNASPRSHSNYCASGPNPCWYYSVGNGDPSAFVDALREIQQSAIGCVYNMPRTDAGVVDPARVRVTYSAGGVPPAQTIPSRASSMDCGSGGWYYDNPTRPTTIHLCPSTCNGVKSDTAARVDVIVGCQGS